MRTVDVLPPAQDGHVIGAAVLLGTGAGIAFILLVAHLRGEPREVAGVARTAVLADFLFTATAIVLQPITGVWLSGYSIGDGWIAASIVLYIMTGAFWLPVVWMQMRMRDLAARAVETNSSLPDEYMRLFSWWFAFGFPAFAAVLIIFWPMIARPTHPLLRLIFPFGSPMLFQRFDEVPIGVVAFIGLNQFSLRTASAFLGSTASIISE